MDVKLQALLESAAKDKKGSYTIYEKWKQRLQALNLSTAEYEQSIRTIADKLKV